MSKKTYYEILGVSKTATRTELKIAYRKEARKWHPDFYTMETDEKKHQAEAMIKIINEAYNVLSDSRKRNDYNLALSRGSGFVSMPDFISQEKSQGSSYNSSNANTSKTAKFNCNNELTYILKSVIESLKNKRPIPLYKVSMLHMLFEFGSFTKEEMELINELKSLLYSSVINNWDNYNANGDLKKFKKRY